MPSLRTVFLFVVSTLATMTLSLAVPESTGSNSIQIEKRSLFNDEALIETLKKEAEAKAKVSIRAPLLSSHRLTSPSDISSSAVPSPRTVVPLSLPPDPLRPYLSPRPSGMPARLALRCYSAILRQLRQIIT
ncbi:hypothetical protein E4T56_gene2329 [Termitomyces sp. T112]|nr:hypothetical protein E4T56_gene2329 [Termitomyces sp. T112]